MGVELLELRCLATALHSRALNQTDQRGNPRIDVPELPNPPGGNGCDIGAYEIPLSALLPQIEIPIRWCVVDGAPSFSSPPVQEDVNAVLRERHVLTSNSIFEPQAGIRFRSAANIQIPNYPILPDPDLSGENFESVRSVRSGLNPSSPTRASGSNPSAATSE